MFERLKEDLDRRQKKLDDLHMALAEYDAVTEGLEKEVLVGVTVDGLRHGYESLKNAIQEGVQLRAREIMLEKQREIQAKIESVRLDDLVK